MRAHPSISIGKRIRFLRLSAKMDGFDLAKGVGVDCRTLDDWENHRSQPDTVDRIMLSRVLRVPTRWLA